MPDQQSCIREILLWFCITQKKDVLMLATSILQNQEGNSEQILKVLNSPAVLFVVIPVSVIFSIAEGWIGPFPRVTFLVSISLMPVFMMIVVLWQMSIRRVTVPATVIMVCILLESFHICLTRQRLQLVS